MKQHSRDMSNMIIKLKSTGHNLTYEQQVQIVVQSFINSLETYESEHGLQWEYKDFFYIACHIELKDEHLKVDGLSVHAYVVKSSSTIFVGFKDK